VTLESDDPGALAAVEALSVTVDFGCYGRRGPSRRAQHAVLPTAFPAPAAGGEAGGLPAGAPIPVRTHLISHLDNPLSVVERYAAPLVRARAAAAAAGGGAPAGGRDVVCIAESTFAIMQGRFRHPDNVRPSLLARLACRLFYTTSSLATACGMQALVDCVGRARVLWAVAFGAASRLLGVRGGFYRAAGPQSRTVDDVSGETPGPGRARGGTRGAGGEGTPDGTDGENPPRRTPDRRARPRPRVPAGTLPPFDKFIVLGPHRADEICQAIADRLGVEVAVADANNLGRVDVLGRSRGVVEARVAEALAANPQGNSDERTPLVVVPGAAA